MTDQRKAPIPIDPGGGTPTRGGRRSVQNNPRVKPETRIPFIDGPKAGDTYNVSPHDSIPSRITRIGWKGHYDLRMYGSAQAFVWVARRGK